MFSGKLREEDALRLVKEANRDKDLCDELDLIGITSLDAAAAKALARYQGDLDLPNVKKITKEVAVALTKRGNIYLNGLTSIDQEVAKVLIKSVNHLMLNGSNTAAESLSKHEGEINCIAPKEWVQSLKK